MHAKPNLAVLFTTLCDGAAATSKSIIFGMRGGRRVHGETVPE